MTNTTEATLVCEAGEAAIAMRDRMPHIRIRPFAGAAEWQSPLLQVEVIDRMQDRVECLNAFKLMHLAPDELGIHVIVRDSSRGITIGLWVSWVDDQLQVLVAPAEVEQAKDVLYRVHSITVLPELMRAGAGGKLLLPVSTGSICSPAGKPKLRDRFLIYGEQERWELVPMLPVCGVQTPAGGVACLVTEGACDAWCAIETDGAGGGTVAMGAMLRRQWIDPVDWSHRVFRYRFLDARDELVHTTAKWVRRHVMDDLGKQTLAARAAASPACAYQQQAYTMKLFHGIQRQGIMMYGQENRDDELLFKRVMTFRQAEAGLKRLRDAGLDKVYLQTVGWNPRGHDGAWPTCFPIDRRFGGEAGLRAMIGTAKELGYQIATHLNFGMSCFSSPDFDPDLVINDIWGEPKVTGDWGGGVHSTHWGLALPEEFIMGRLCGLRELGFNGMQYLDFQGNPLYLNYHPRAGGPRADFAAGICRYQEAAVRVFGGVQIETGFLYCAAGADATVGPFYQPLRPKMTARGRDWPILELLDRQVPLYQLAMHDLITQEQHGVEWSSVMTGILFGRVMRDEWSAEPGVMPVLDDDRIARLKAIYDLGTERFGHLVTPELTHWEPLADKVEKTRFADGTEVVADFNEERLTVNGEAISQPAALAAPRS